MRIAEERGVELWDLSDEDYCGIFQNFLSADVAPGVREVLSTQGSVNARAGQGGTAFDRVSEQIETGRVAVDALQQFADSTSDGSAFKAPGSI